MSYADSDCGDPRSFIFKVGRKFECGDPDHAGGRDFRQRGEQASDGRLKLAEPR